MGFYEALHANLLQETKNHYTDNYDYVSKGEIPVKKKVYNFIKDILFSPFVFRYFTSTPYIFNHLILGKSLKLAPYMDKVKDMYDRLENQESKDLLIKIMSFRIMGYHKVKLPYHHETYWSDLEKFTAIRDESNFIALDFKPWKLFYQDLNPYNIDVKLYFTSHRNYSVFIKKHYQYVASGEVIVDVEKDDVVMDLGGCYGDTALYFSRIIGPTGKIYSFEFIPGSIDIFNRNLDLNDSLKGNISIVKRPLWNKSGLNIYFQDKGGASKVSFDNFEGNQGSSTTITLDDFVMENNLEKVDFIKTDIEGAEPYMLEGALETIKRFKPKMAISIYHNLDDFTGIINQIDGLNLGYKFYIGHASMYASETVLFCKV